MTAKPKMHATDPEDTRRAMCGRDSDWVWTRPIGMFKQRRRGEKCAACALAMRKRGTSR